MKASFQNLFGCLLAAISLAPANVAAQSGQPTFSDANWISMGGIPGVNGRVYAAVIDGAGNLYIGGSFTLVGNVLATNIAKWNGTSWSPLGSGMNRFGEVFALAVSGTDLYAGGSFSTAGGVAANSIAKWNGSSWSTLGFGGWNTIVLALAVSGSDVYAGGYFNTLGGGDPPPLIPIASIAKWNGSSWSTLGSGGWNTIVSALAVSGSDVYAGGSFTNMGGVLANYIAKWNGSSWSALGPGMNGGVSALAVSGSDLYAGGASIAKWNGTSWSALGSGVNWTVRALAVLGTDVYAGGEFWMAGGSPAANIAKWNGSSWSALGSGMNHRVFALAVSGSDLYAGGLFTMAGGKASAHVARAVLGDAPGYNQLAGAPLSGGAMQFSYIGYPATDYALDRAFNLAGSSWVGQRTNTMSVSGVLLFTNTPAPGTNNFWRVRSVP